MGLDMYLTGKRYLWDFPETSPDKVITSAIGSQFPELKGKRIKGVSCELGYWRKANAIHKWFVDNCQDGRDECQETEISRDDLQKLLDACRQVLKNKKLANELLPPASGFFFGSTDVDQYYFDDIQSTIAILEHVLSPELDGWEIYYQASW
jgi:hypothetical protein